MTQAKFNPDFRDMLCALRDENAEFLVVGAYALAVHGISRATSDFDIWIRASSENAQRVWRALARFGAPMDRLTIDDFQNPDMVVQIGVVPHRIDMITAIEGVDFDEAWGRRVTGDFDGVFAPVISAADMIVNKQSTGRAKDQGDAERLKELLKRQST